MRRIPILILLSVFALAAGCGPSKEVAAKKAAADAAARKPVEAPKPPPPPPSEFDTLRKQLAEFTTLATACDKGWFAKVDPNKIDKWELAIDIPSMEEKCDPLLRLFEALYQPAGFRHPALDEYLRTAALATDRYMFLAFRCKKVGVRDKIPYKKMLTELRDALRADVAGLAPGLEKVLKLTDADLQGTGSLAIDARRTWTLDAVARLPQDFTSWISAPRKDNAPIWRYSLMTTSTIGTRAAATLGTPQLSVDPAVVKAAGDLAAALAGAWQFWSGDYFEAEEKGSPEQYKAMKKVSDGWRKAFAKAYPKAGK
jgi:hypothetical protein